MVKRLLVGLIVGLFVGAIFAATLIKGLGMTVFDGAGGIALAYVFAAITGAVTGLVAGKPFWSSEAKIEGGLKAFFGALLGAGGMFALQHWLSIPVNLTALGAGEGAFGMLPAATLPAIGAALGAIFEIDNSGEDKSEAKKAGGKRVADLRHEATGPTKAKGQAREEVEDEEEAVASRRARR